MTNTLYLWDGIIETARNWPNNGGPAEVKIDGSRPRGKFPVIWKGRLLRLINRPDSRSVGVPRKGSVFPASVSSEFVIEGVAMEQKNDSPKESDDKRIPYLVTFGSDVVEHEVLLPTMTYWDVRSHWDGKPLVKAVVVGRGRNAYGPFIETGWIPRPGKGWDDKKSIHVTLVRRYISSNDKRAQWSLHELKNAVMADVICPSEEERRPPVLLPPWRCLALHSDESMSQGAQSGKRKRGKEDITSHPAVCMLPGDDKQFSLELRRKVASHPDPAVNMLLRDRDDDLFPKCEAKSILWEDQCWGCGGHTLRNGDYPVKITWDLWSQEEPERNILEGEFCQDKSECIIKALPELQAFLKLHTERLKYTGYFIQAFSEDGFWKVIRENPEWHEKLTASGWEDRGGETWYYGPFRDSDESEYESE